MDETLTTAGEPQVIESANTYEGDTQTAGLAQTIDTQVQDDGSQVIESATPMDNNITYQNVTEDTTPSFDMNKDFTQNLIQTALQTNYQNTVAQTDGQAMTQFLDHDYDYNKSEAGTYWVAGAINDVDTQMSFLNTLVREEMYDELDLQKYYYDTTIATARAYASQKKKETAYGFYRAAQEKAIAEAQLTGWYMPAEGNYMLGQYTVAQNKLEDPDSTPEEKARAQRISGTVEKWFAANQIGTRGIKCLNMMNYEENVRHNKIMGELQKEANKIAAAGNGISAAMADLNWKIFKFKLEEEELATGYNYSQIIGMDNDSTIGHDVERDYGKYTNLRGYKDTYVEIPKVDEKGNPVYGSLGFKKTLVGYNKDGSPKYENKEVFGQLTEKVKRSAAANLLKSSPFYYSSVLGNTSKEAVDRILKENGMDPTKYFTQYDNDQTLATIKAYLNSEAGAGKTSIDMNSGAFKKTGEKVDGNEVVTIVVGNKVVAGYFKNGLWTQLTDGNKLTSDGKTTLETYLKRTYGNNINWGNVNSVSIDGQTYTFGRGPQNTSLHSWDNYVANGYEKATNDNFNYTLNDKMKETLTLIQNGGRAVTEDGEEIGNLKLVNDYHDTAGFDDYTLLVNDSDPENLKYYTLNKDGTVQETDKTEKTPKASKTLKVGDSVATYAGYNGNGDMVLKSSYIAKQWTETNEHGETITKAIMLQPRDDGPDEWYEIQSYGSSLRNGTGAIDGKVTKVNLSDDYLKEKGVSFTNKVGNTSDTIDAKYNSEPSAQAAAEKNTEEMSYNSTGSGQGGASKSVEDKGLDEAHAAYEEYKARHDKEEPNAPLLPYNEWYKNYAEGINSVRT